MKIKTEIAGETFTFKNSEGLKAAVAARLQEAAAEMNELKKAIDVLNKKAKTFKQFIVQETTSE